MSGQPAPGDGVPTCYRHPDRETYIRCQRCDRPICPDCMRDAAVGFQCVGCIAEGARETRAGRAPYGGKPSANPALTSIVLIVMNAGVWLALLATGGQASSWFYRLALSPIGTCESRQKADGTFALDSESACLRWTNPPGDGLWTPGVADGALWQMLTSAFAHVEPMHIGFNMLALWVLGPQLEQAIGRVRFLALYLLSALAGSVVVLWLASETSATLGASGAIFGLMGGLLVLTLKVGGNATPLLGWIGINVVITVLGSQFISWQGHLGGLIGGLLSAAIILYAPRAGRSVWQAVGLGALLLLLIAATALRVVALG
ncbi:rhomboid family intramembrane serine protease [Nocardioides pacificus]